MSLLHYTPRWLHKLFPRLIWRSSAENGAIYLTFDDGPIPEVTPKVLSILAAYKAKATFFCVGENAVKHAEVLAQVKAAGHAIGHHTYHHVNGWHTKWPNYLREVEKGAEACSSSQGSLFRPPYGKLPMPAYFRLPARYKVVMWDVLSGDFDKRINWNTCLEQTIKHTSAGSVIVFHDSIKAWPNLERLLPAYLEWAKKQGYTFKSLS